MNSLLNVLCQFNRSSKFDTIYARWLESCAFVGALRVVGLNDESFPINFWEQVQSLTSHVGSIFKHQICMVYFYWI